MPSLSILGICILLICGADTILAGAEPKEVKGVYCLIPSLLSTRIRPVAVPVAEGIQLEHANVAHIVSDITARGVDVVISPELARRFAQDDRAKSGLSWEWIDNIELNREEVRLDTRSLSGLLKVASSAVSRAGNCEVHYEPSVPIQPVYPRLKTGDRQVVVLIEQKRREVEVASRSIATFFIRETTIVEVRGLDGELPKLWEHALKNLLDESVEVLGYDAEVNVLTVKASARQIRDFLIRWD